jgi:arylsulfatase A-like enzyme
VTQARGLRLILYLLILGVVLGACVGLLERVVAVLGGGLADSGLAVQTAAYYAIVWGAGGLLLGALAWTVAAATRRPPDTPGRRAFYAGALAAALVFVHLAAWLHLSLRIPAFSVHSLSLGLALFALSVGIWYAVWRAGKRIEVSGSRPAAWRSPLALLSFALVCLLATSLGVVRASTGHLPAAVQADPQAPNVLVLLADAMRADHLGCYGYGRSTSPTVDRLAAEGVVFQRAYAHGSRTKESTASMVTSLHPNALNVATLGDVLPADVPTLMELMGGAGHRTAVVSANPLVSPIFGFGRGTDFFYWEPVPLVRGAVLSRGVKALTGRVVWLQWMARVLGALERLVPTFTEAGAFDGNGAPSLNRALLDWIDREPGRKFFAYVHYMEPHSPYDPPPPFSTMFDPDRRGERLVGPPGRVSVAMLPFVEGEELPERDRRSLVAQYDGSIAYWDAELEALLQGLEDRGLSGETLVVVTADHGEEFYDHKGWAHGHSLHEELIRVPLVMWYPGELPGGRRVNKRVRQVDLLPTLLSAVGIGATADMLAVEGVSLWEELAAGAEPEAELPVYSETHLGGNTARAILTGDWKLIHARLGRRDSVMLFDLSSDPLESQDLSLSRREVAAAMLRELDVYGVAGVSSGDRGEAFIDEETRGKLRALGYVE